MKNMNFSFENMLKPLNLEKWENLLMESYQLKKKVLLSRDIEYKNLIFEYLKQLERGKFSLNALTLEKEASAVIQLWISNKEFKDKVPLTSKNLFHILNILKNTKSKLILIDLIELYFKEYDGLGNTGTILIKFIKTHQGLLRREKNIKQIKRLLDSEYKSHKILVDETLRTNETLVHKLGEYGLYYVANGAFINRSRYQMYIRRTELEDLNNLSKLLQEVENNKIYLADYIKDNKAKEKNYLIGHKIIEILLVRLEEYLTNIKDYQNILDFILAISGDPRSSNTTEAYVKWWGILGEDNISKMKRLLSSFDLNMFLETYENYITRNGIENEQRMFIERKSFLRGMLEENLIQETKLFVGSDMEYYLKETYKNSNIRPTYFSITDASRMCVIFMKFNNYMFTEGAFNCTFRMYSDADSIKVFQSKKKNYTYREIGKGLEETANVVATQIHSGNWQNRILNEFRRHCKNRLNHRLFYARNMFGGY